MPGSRDVPYAGYAGLSGGRFKDLKPFVAGATGGVGKRIVQRLAQVLFPDLHVRVNKLRVCLLTLRVISPETSVQGVVELSRLWLSSCVDCACDKRAAHSSA